MLGRAAPHPAHQGPGRQQEEQEVAGEDESDDAVEEDELCKVTVEEAAAVSDAGLDGCGQEAGVDQE